ncbi:MAG: outer membrane lipoprotein-sorting protein [Gammaproteobacteria bacterium]|nr:outer membrane lipoprotein-sorting protein [Gammaproteobacteria bacterium]MDH5802000.1 outer membrane lipoprotein-sorting protein [Gammaproteobacteria bacterium]
MRECLSLSLLLGLLLAGAHSALADTTSLERTRQILRQIDDMWRGDSSHTVMTMEVRTAHYTRNMTMEGWSKGKDKTLVRILKPLKEKGTASLKSGNSIYSYLPKTNRTVRLTSSMMMGSWMGSHFTNDDLVKESRMEDDFNPDISFEGVRDGVPVIEFTLVPKPDAAVVWGKVVVTVQAKTLLPITQLYYDEDMKVARTIRFSDIQKLGGREIPVQMRVVPADKPEEYTHLVYKKLELNIPLQDAFFSLSRLKRQ